MIDKSAYTPLFRQIFDIICRRITEGVYPEASKLPSQLEFAKEFAVSMITVRQAFRELNEKGIVSSKKGFGSLVLKKPQLYVAYHTQWGLTRDSKMRNYRVKSQIIDILPVCKHIEASLAFGNENIQPLCINRLRFVEEKKVALEFSFLNLQLLQKTNWKTDFKDDTSLYTFIQQHYGYNIIRAIESLWPLIPQKEVMNSLGMKKVMPIFFVKRETYIEQAAQPIEYCESYILPEYYGKIIYSLESHKTFH